MIKSIPIHTNHRYQNTYKNTIDLAKLYQILDLMIFLRNIIYHMMKYHGLNLFLIKEYLLKFVIFYIGKCIQINIFIHASCC